jgi:hypothetical protein
MARAVVYLLELIGLFGLIGIVAFISWTKMILGAVLSLVGAFFPRVGGRDSADRGSGEINIQQIAIRMIGGVRVLVVIGGIILIVGSILDGHEGYVRDRDTTLARQEARRALSQQQIDRLINGMRDEVREVGDPEARDRIEHGFNEIRDEAENAF